MKVRLTFSLGDLLAVVTMAAVVAWATGLIGPIVPVALLICFAAERMGYWLGFTIVVASSDTDFGDFLTRIAAFLRSPASVADSNGPPAEPQSIKLEPHLRRWEGERDSLMPQIVIDRKVFTAFDHGPIDLSELERSLAVDGTYFIWSCECGAPGCAGRFSGVRVEHSNGVVRWHDLDMGHHYCFNLADLTTAFDAVQVAARQVMLEHPSLDIAPHQNIPFFSCRAPGNSI